MADIDSRFLLEPLSESTTKKCEAIVASYSDDAEPSWKWGPNAADFDLLSPPSGFSLSVNANSEVAPDVFHPRKMFYGTAAFEIPAELLQPGDVIKRKAEIKEALSKIVVPDAVEPSMQNFSTKTHRDAFDWNSSLGDRGAYAGVFASEKRGDDEYVQTVWLVVRAGVPKASEELYEKLEKASGVKTWKAFFLDDPETQRVYDFARRNRERLLGAMGNHLFPGRLVAGKDLQSKTQKESLLKPTIETLSHTIEFDETEQRATYYSNTVDASTIQRGGYIFNETPALGPIIIKQNERFSGFSSGQILPTSTGRKEKLNVSPNELRKEVRDTFFWDTSDDANKRLERGIFRVRDEAFKAVEAKMGYDHTVEELALKPLIVRVCV